jgi:hypothetical protein
MNHVFNRLKKAKTLAGNCILDAGYKKLLFAFALLVTFAAVFAINMAQPLFTDDWEYSFLHRLYDCSYKGTVSDEKIASISNIFESQYEHYFTWGGRSICHFIAQLLLFIGTPCNKILNALAYLALAYVIYRFAKKQNEQSNFSLFLLINILIFFFQPVLGSTILWITGSANYLWGTLIFLLFVLQYKYLIDNQSYRHAEGGGKTRYFSMKTVYMFPFGVIAGWTNENTAIAVICLLAVFFVYLKIIRQKIPCWYSLGFAGMVTGFLFMILAPGNYLRYETTVLENNTLALSGFRRLAGQFITAASGIFFYLFLIINLYFIVLLLYRHKGLNNAKALIQSLSFFCCALLATLAMTFSPVFPERAWFGIIIFIIVAIAGLYNQLDFSNRFLRNLRRLVLSGATLGMVGLYASGYKDLSKAQKVFNKREQFIAEQKKKGVVDFIFDEEITSKSRINNLYDLTNKPDYWTNCFYARYYGVNSVIVVNPDYK